MNLRTENSGTWISVENRLPDDSMKDRTILTCVRHRFGGMTFGMVRWFGPEKTKGWQDVTHWMPIPDLSEGEEGDGRTVGREVRLMDRKKPLKDWTLAEAKALCKASECNKCIVWDDRAGWCALDGISPCAWDLADPPHWTKDDIEDAKAVKRDCPWATEVKRDDPSGNCVVLVPERGSLVLGCPDLFPSLRPGECVTLQEILDAEELLHDNT